MDVSLAGHFLAAASPSVIRHGGPGGLQASVSAVPRLPGPTGARCWVVASRTWGGRTPEVGRGRPCQPDLGSPDPGPRKWVEAGCTF